VKGSSADRQRHNGRGPQGIKTFNHDFGPYMEVVCYYDTDDEQGTDYAFHCESDAPETWDDVNRIRECQRRGRCKIRQFVLSGTKRLVAVGTCRRLVARQLRELRDCPTSMFQTHCNCAASRQVVPPIPFSAHQLLAKLLVPEGETAPRPPRTRPNRNRKLRQNAA
jgi:hypothetical protein